MKIGENTFLMRKSFSPSFMMIEQKLWIFYKWPIFECVWFFFTQTLRYLIVNISHRSEILGCMWSGSALWYRKSSELRYFWEADRLVCRKKEKQNASRETRTSDLLINKSNVLTTVLNITASFQSQSFLF